MSCIGSERADSYRGWSPTVLPTSFSTNSLYPIHIMPSFMLLISSTWKEINLPTPSFFKVSTTLLLVLLMCDKWSYGFTTNHLLCFVNLPSHHQFFETWIIVTPFGTLLSMLIIARESPSTINGFHWCCKAQYTPLMRPSTPNKLLVLVPMLPQNMVRILSGESLIAPPKPTGPRFPFPAPLKLILKSPTRGHCQKSKL